LYLRNHRSELKCAYENYDGNNRGINGPGSAMNPLSNMWQGTLLEAYLCTKNSWRCWL